MLEIMEKQKLELKNLFCFRGKVKQTEVDSIVKAMEGIFLKENNYEV